MPSVLTPIVCLPTLPSIYYSYSQHSPSPITSFSLFKLIRSHLLTTSITAIGRYKPSLLSYPPSPLNDLPIPSNTIANFQVNHFTACSPSTTSLSSPYSLPLRNPYTTLVETGRMGGSFPNFRRRTHGITSIPSPPTTHTRSTQLLLFAILISSRSIPRRQPPHQHTYQITTTTYQVSTQSNS
jgi:hypothetical protein